jgi:hypothetical protein
MPVEDPSMIHSRDSSWILITYFQTFGGVIRCFIYSHFLKHVDCCHLRDLFKFITPIASYIFPAKYICANCSRVGRSVLQNVRICRLHLRVSSQFWVFVTRFYDATLPAFALFVLYNLQKKWLSKSGLFFRRPVAVKPSLSYAEQGCLRSVSYIALVTTILMPWS